MALDYTYCVRQPHRTGQLARVAGSIAKGNGLIGEVNTINVGRNSSTREITLEVDDYEQAEHIATTKLTNCGHNCNATQVLVLSQDWPLADKLIAEVRSIMRDTEPRPAYYPRTQERIAKACSDTTGAEFLCSEMSRALIPDVDPRSATSILTEEVFAGVLGIVRLPGQTPRNSCATPSNSRTTFSPDPLARSLPSIPKPASTTLKLSMRRSHACDTAPSASTYGPGWYSHWRLGAPIPAIRHRTSAAESAWCTTPSCCRTPKSR